MQSAIPRPGWLLQAAAIPILSLAAIGTASAQAPITSDEAGRLVNGYPAAMPDQSGPSEQLIRNLVLVLMPERFEDEDDWGRTKRVQSGLNVDLRGFRLDTSRRWKEVNHGTWRRYTAWLVEPEKTFSLTLTPLPSDANGNARYQVAAVAKLRVSGRQQNWQYGARLLSLSADAEAWLVLDAILRVENNVVTNDGDASLQFLPRVEAASLRLREFNLRRVSHMKGEFVRELGDASRSFLRRAIQRKNESLVSKLNSRLEKKQESFAIPLGDWNMFREPTSAEPGPLRIPSGALPTDAESPSERGVAPGELRIPPARTMEERRP